MVKIEPFKQPGTRLDRPVVMFTALGQRLAGCQEKCCLKERPKCGTGRRGLTVNQWRATDLQVTLQPKVPNDTNHPELFGKQ